MTDSKLADPRAVAEKIWDSVIFNKHSIYEIIEKALAAARRAAFEEAAQVADQDAHVAGDIHTSKKRTAECIAQAIRQQAKVMP